MSIEFLIGSLIKQGYLVNPNIIEAFRKIDRKDFVLERFKNGAYIDKALPIGSNQTISQPLTVAFMLEKLNPRKGEYVLDIGSGSGWTSALLAFLINKNPINKVKNSKSFVVAIERIAKLCERGYLNSLRYFKCKMIKNRSDFKEEADIYFYNAQGLAGFPYVGNCFFDKILVSARSEIFFPSWKKQLKIGGKIIIPMKNSLFLFSKISKTRFIKDEFPGFVFVPFVK